MIPKYLVVHTVAVKGEVSFESIKRYHVEKRGWEDIGYHYYIRKDGTIRKGRKDDKVGAHCRAANMNYKSLGICFEGHHDYEEWTSDQKTSLKLLSASLANQYDIPDERIIGHREAYDMEGVERKKTCPGKKIDMDKVRDKYGKRDISKIEVAGLENLKGGKVDINKLASKYEI